MTDNNILVFGASIVYGAADEEMGGWANRFNVYLAKKTDWDIHSYNLGVSGDTTEDLLKRFEFECSDRRHPSMIIIALGTNDSRYINDPSKMETSPEKFRENVSKLIDMAKSRVDKVAVSGPTPVNGKLTMPIPWRKEMFYTQANAEKYRDIAKEVCEEKGVPFIDMMKVIPEATETMFKDGLHPNAEGHQKMFEAVKQFLEENKWI